jgi:hypothetical protein
VPSEILEVQILLGEVFVVRLFRFGRLLDASLKTSSMAGLTACTDGLSDVTQEADIHNKPKRSSYAHSTHAGPHRLAA